MAKVLKIPDTVKRLAVDGAVAVGNTPEEFGASRGTVRALRPKVANGSPVLFADC